jgi:hypothetical protein
MVWSPDNQMIAFGSQDEIQIIDLAIGKIYHLVDLLMGSHYLHGISWSPDGQYIAYITDGNENNEVIYQVSPWGGSPRLVVTSKQTTEEILHIAGWLNVIVPFQPGRVYKVAILGDHQPIYSAPGNENKSLGELIKGEKVQVKDGPSIVNGEQWWKIGNDRFTGWIEFNADRFQDAGNAYFFRKGNILDITPLGVDLNFRTIPSINGDIVRKLVPGEKIQVIEGSVLVDKYAWWKVKVLSSQEEGWVVENLDWYKLAK